MRGGGAAVCFVAAQVRNRGRCPYNAPEDVVTPKMDIYSLGYLMAEMAAVCGDDAELDRVAEFENIAQMCMEQDPCLRPRPRDVEDLLHRAGLLV